ncbi:MAG: glycosyltransferase [Hahellaceae bacterium]|nr:glycosyltransferase [Hahellaceae bacterium]
MKILYISNSKIPSDTANSLHVMKACRSLAKLGFDVILLCPRYKYKRQSDCVSDNIFEYYAVENNFKLKQINIPATKGKTFIYMACVLYWALRLRPNLIYSRFLLGSFIPFLFFRGIFESHSPVWREGVVSKFIFSMLVKFRRLQSLVVITHSLKIVYDRAFPEMPNIIVAPDGADPVSTDRLFNSVSLMGQPRRLQVGYTGHLYPGKGMEIISAIADIATWCEFHVVGGTEKDIEHWKSRVTSENIYFYGFKPQKMVDSYIDLFDVCLLPNQAIVLASGADNILKSGLGDIGSYTSPLKMFQYMAHGKAILASDLPVLREILNDENSVLVSPNDPYEWVSALDRLRDASIRKEIGQSALNDFNNFYSWDQRMHTILFSSGLIAFDSRG